MIIERWYKNLDDNLSAVSVAVFIKLTYLVKFPDDENATKQEISIYAMSRGMGQTWSASPMFMEANLLINITSNRFTWAEDIINHFSNYVKGRFRDVGRVSIFVSKLINSKQNQNIVLLCMILFVLVMITLSLNKVLDESAEIFLKYNLQNIEPNLEGANRKLDLLIERTINVSTRTIGVRHIFPYAIYFLTAFLTIYVLPISLSYLSDRSYVSIGSNSVEKNEQKIKKRNVLKYSIMMASIFSIICSLTANAIWEKVKFVFE